MRDCDNCEVALMPGEWHVESITDDGEIDVVTCDRCHRAYEQSERNYQASCLDVELRESELAEEEPSDMYNFL